LVHFVFIWYIFPVLVSCTKKNLATLVGVMFRSPLNLSHGFQIWRDVELASSEAFDVLDGVAVRNLGHGHAPVLVDLKHALKFGQNGQLLLHIELIFKSQSYDHELQITDIQRCKIYNAMGSLVRFENETIVKSRMIGP
jgi:hypothetical protein